jgi:GMP synthase-like glutamine amidotransferase
MNRPRVHWFQHVPFEGLDSIEPWLQSQGAEISRTAFWQGEEPPQTRDFDALIIMGGPMSVHDEAAYPWLRREKEIIREAIDQNRIVLGICLGAQLVAEVMGGEVTRNPEREIGWFPIHQATEAPPHPFRDLLPHHDEVFHWHGETFSIPPGAILLARSAACLHQAFAMGDRVLALQFHLEATVDSAKAMVENGADDLLKPGPYVQSAEDILDHPPGTYARINAVMVRLLAALPWASL